MRSLKIILIVLAAVLVVYFLPVAIFAAGGFYSELDDFFTIMHPTLKVGPYLAGGVFSLLLVAGLIAIVFTVLGKLWAKILLVSLVLACIINVFIFDNNKYYCRVKGEYTTNDPMDGECFHSCQYNFTLFTGDKWSSRHLSKDQVSAEEVSYWTNEVDRIIFEVPDAENVTARIFTNPDSLSLDQWLADYEVGLASVANLSNAKDIDSWVANTKQIKGVSFQAGPKHYISVLAKSKTNLIAFEFITKDDGLGRDYGYDQDYLFSLVSTEN